MSVNRPVIALVLLLAAGGFYRVYAQKQGSFGRVLIGAYVLALILSLVDLFGGVASEVISGIAYVAMLGTVLELGGALTFLSNVGTAGSEPGQTGVDTSGTPASGGKNPGVQ